MTDEKMVRAVSRTASTGRPTRRTVLRASALPLAAAALAACAPPPPPPGAGTSGGGSAGSATTQRTLPADTSASDKLVRFSNWTDYLDRSEDDKHYPTLDGFTKATGIKVDYVEDIDDNDAFANKILPELRAGQDVGRDIVVFSDWMINRLIGDDLVAPLDHSAFPNLTNVLDALHNVTFDKGRKYSVPWQSGFTGIAYNKRKVGRELKSVDDLWAADLKGRVTLLTEMRDTAGLVMLAQGTDISSPFAATAIERAFEEVKKRISDGNVRRVRGNSYVEDFKSGNAVAGMAWSGDIFSLNNELGSEEWAFVMPESGGTLWSDDAMIPVTSAHRAAATTLLDYYYDPAVAARVAAWVNYVCPVKGAQEAMTKIDPKLAASPFIFPDAAYLKTTHEFRALTSTEDAQWSAAWAKVIGN